MITDRFLWMLTSWAVQRLPVELLVAMLDTLPSRYGPRVRA